MTTVFYDNKAVGGDRGAIDVEVGTAVGHVRVSTKRAWWEFATHEPDGAIIRWSKWTGTGRYCSPSVAATFVETGSTDRPPWATSAP